VGLVPDDFLPKSFDLIEQETSKDGASVWPLGLLCFSDAFMTSWRAFGQALHETDSKYPLYSTNLHLEILGKCAQKDGLGSNGIGGHLFYCQYSTSSFAQGDRPEGFSFLEQALSTGPKSEWALGYLDYEIQQSSIKRGDLDIREWLHMYKATVVSFESTYESEDTHEVLSADSARGLYCPINEEDYWAWRMGWVIASGRHLKDEIMDLAFRKEFDQDPNELVALVQSVPISITLDLMQSFGPDSDWRALNRDISEIYFSISQEKFRTREISVSELGVIVPKGYSFTNHGEDKKHWLIKLGFIWYIRSQSLLKSSGESFDEDSVVESLDKQWTDSNDERMMNLLSSSQVPTIEGIEGLTALFRSFINQQSAAQNSRETSNNQQITQIPHQQLIELLGGQLCDALSPDSRLELRWAESHFQKREEGDSAYEASQRYANCVEGQLNGWFWPLFQDLIERMGYTAQDRPKRPRTIPQWGYSFKNDILRLANGGIDFRNFWPGFDPVQIGILAERLLDLNEARSLAHAGISRAMPNEARGLVLGELVGETGPGILQIMAKLANRVFSK
jgi:hypothetical protein